MNKCDFSLEVSRFFIEYLTNQRMVSINTLKTYRDTFVHLLNFFDKEFAIKPNELKFSDFTIVNIEKFLNWLETEKRLSVNTRNNRLAAIKSFFRYLSYRKPEISNISSAILSLHQKKTETPTINYLTIEAFKHFISIFDRSDIQQLRDYCIIALLYESGARVSELSSIITHDLRTNKPSTLLLHGKGNKDRIVPIHQNLINDLVKYKELYNVDEHSPLFFNRHGKKLTREGINYILQKYFTLAKQINPSIYPYSISPHCLRHSRAMHLLEKDVNLIFIRDILGHSSVTTTEIYSRANPEIKRKFINKVSDELTRESQTKIDDQEKSELLEWLRKSI